MIKFRSNKIILIVIASIFVAFALLRFKHHTKQKHYFSNFRLSEEEPSTAYTSIIEYAKESASTKSEVFMKRTSIKPEQKNTNCNLWDFKPRWKELPKPQITLDPTRFLYPGILWGTNNQLLGFKLTVYLAILLNRTIVIPHFHLEGSDNEISAFQLYDVERICSLVSCATIERQKTFCNNSFHVAFKGMNVYEDEIKKNEKETGMSIIDVKKYSSVKIPGATKLLNNANIPALPDSSYTTKINLWISSKSTVLKKAFKTTAACAIWACVFRPMSPPLKNNVGSPLEGDYDVKKLPDDVIYSAVTEAMRHPPYIVDAAARYTQAAFANKSFVAVHWRYNKDDWNLICTIGNIATVEEKRVCKDAFKLTPTDVAAGIVRSLSKDKFVNETDDDIFVYIAAPPSLTDFKNKLYNEIGKLNKRFVKPSVQLKGFLVDKFESCWKGNKWINVNEVESLVEMEIMVNSFWFFHSLGSTWSDNIRPWRWTRQPNGKIEKKPEFSVFDVGLEAMTNRLS